MANIEKSETEVGESGEKADEKVGTQPANQATVKALGDVVEDMMELVKDLHSDVEGLKQQVDDD